MALPAHTTHLPTRPQQDLPHADANQHVNAPGTAVVFQLGVGLAIPIAQPLAWLAINPTAPRLGSMAPGLCVEKDWEELHVDDQVKMSYPPAPWSLDIVPPEIVPGLNVFLGQQWFLSHGVEVIASGMNRRPDSIQARLATSTLLQHLDRDLLLSLRLRDHVLTTKI